MANQRSEDQTMVGFWAPRDLVALIHKARGHTPISTWLRESAKKDLESRGYKVPDSLTAAPDRHGKGGPKTYPAHRSSAVLLNDKPAPSSTFVPPGELATGALTKKPLRPGSSTSPATAAPTAPVSTPKPKNQTRRGRPPTPPAPAPE